MKDWYYLTFFPQEDVNQLTQLKSSLTPFLKSIEKALSFELENQFIDSRMNETIINAECVLLKENNHFHQDRPHHKMIEKVQRKTHFQ